MSRLIKREPIRNISDSTSKSIGLELNSPPVSPVKKAVRREPIRNSIDTSVESTTEANSHPSTIAPSTPKRKRTVDIPLTPDSTKKLRFTADQEILGTSGLQTPPTTPTVYSLGKSVFQRGSDATGIIGREQERSKINDFIKSRITGQNGIHNGALYLSGLPGTGKSALLSEVVDDLMKKNKSDEYITPRIANINCMIVDRPELIYARILKELNSNENEEEEEQGDLDDNSQLNQIVSHGIDKVISDLDKLFLNRTDRRSCIVILDELDHVVTKDQEVLFRIFQWAFINSSNLILIGIANALDLTDRFLPRLRSNGLTPQLLAFSPYSASDIERIVIERLRSLLPANSPPTDPLPLMQLAAIQLCSRKAAANTGDLRKAFDICRRAVEVVEEEVRRKFVSSDDNEVEQTNLPASWKRAIVNGHKSMALTSLSLQDAPKVTVAHIARVCANAFGGSTTGRIKSMNLQQKAVLCVLVISEANNTSSTINNSMTVSKLFDRYSQICDREKSIGRLHFNEYLEVISALEFSGVVNVSGVCGRKGLGVASSRRKASRGGGGASSGQRSLGSREEYSQRRISSNVHRIDLISTISDIPLLKQFLETNF